MRYNVKIYDPWWRPLARIYQPNIFNISYTKKLNDAGECSFGIIASHPSASRGNLRKANKIELLFGDTVIWNGLINNPLLGDEVHEINAIGLLGLMGTINITDKLTYKDLNSNIARAIFTEFLGEYESGISYGNILISVPVVVEEEFNHDKYLDAIERIRKTCNAEMKIGLDRKFYMLDNIGEDKSQQITLRYNQDYVGVSNIKNSFQIIDDLSEYANTIIGKSVGTASYEVTILGETYTLTNKTNNIHVEKDLTEIEKYGIVSEFIDYGENIDEAALIEKTKSELESKINNIRIDNIEILKDKIDFQAIDIGDKIQIDIKNQYYQIRQNYKLTSITNTITDSSENILKVGVSLEDRKLPPLTFNEYLVSLNKRLNFIEKRI